MLLIFVLTPHRQIFWKSKESKEIDAIGHYPPPLRHAVLAIGLVRKGVVDEPRCHIFAYIFTFLAFTIWIPFF